MEPTKPAFEVALRAGGSMDGLHQTYGIGSQHTWIDGGIGAAYSALQIRVVDNDAHTPQPS